MERQQFTFYRSFWEALCALPKSSQLTFVKALCAYALDGEDTQLSGSAASAYYIVKPILDNARLKSEKERKGEKKGQQGETENKNRQNRGERCEANALSSAVADERAEERARKQEEEQDKEQGEEQDKGKVKDKDKVKVPAKDDDDPPDPPGAAGAVRSAVVAVVAGAVGELSDRARAELEGYVREMGEGCVFRALDAAKDAGKPTWAYVRGILRCKREQGITTVEGWDRAEERYRSAKGRRRGGSAGRNGSAGRGGAGNAADCQPDPERIKKNSEWLENFLAGNAAPM